MAARGRAVLVTGASRGIGAAIARAFAAAGDRVAVHYGASRAAADEVAASLEGDGHVVVGADLADPEAVRAMVAAAAEGLGGLDVLVNNAGVFTPHPITETTYEEWQRAWHRHAGGQPARPRQRHVVRGAAHDRGRRRADRQRLLARGLPRRAEVARVRREQGRPRRVRPVAGPRPGPAPASPSPPSPRGGRRPTWPPTTLAGPRADEIRAESPLGRVAAAEDVARAVLYLASPEAEMASGSVLDVNGASFLRM